MVLIPSIYRDMDICPYRPAPVAYSILRDKKKKRKSLPNTHPHTHTPPLMNWAYSSPQSMLEMITLYMSQRWLHLSSPAKSQSPLASLLDRTNKAGCRLLCAFNHISKKWILLSENDEDMNVSSSRPIFHTIDLLLIIVGQCGCYCHLNYRTVFSLTPREWRGLHKSVQSLSLDHDLNGTQVAWHLL